jgi:hypothetical protein
MRCTEPPPRAAVSMCRCYRALDSLPVLASGAVGELIVGHKTPLVMSSPPLSVRMLMKRKVTLKKVPAPWLWLTLLILSAIVDVARAQGEIVPWGGFESPALPPGGYAEGSEANGLGLTFSQTLPGDWARSGILRPPTSFSDLEPAFGEQYAVLRSGGSFLLGFSLPEPGQYLLTYWVAPQADGYLDYGLELNPSQGIPLLSKYEQTTVEFGWHQRQLEFEGGGEFWFRSNPTLDYFVFIDGISIVPVPEPSVMALLSAGLVASFVALRQRARRFSALRVPHSKQ